MEYPNKRSEVEITLDSVYEINHILEGESDSSLNEKKDCVKRNVGHLEIVKGGSYIDLSQFSAAQIAEIDEAISKGNSYISSL